MKLKYLIMSLLLMSSIAFGVEPTVIGGTDAKLTKFDRDIIIQIFTKKKKFWENGDKISVYIKPQNSIEHKLFVIDVLKLSPFSYKRMLESITYSGLNIPPIEVNSDEQMLTLIADTPNAVGYINHTVYIKHLDDTIIAITLD